MRSHQGTTLIEVIIAMVIFTVVMAYGMTFFVFARSSTAKADEFLYGVQIGNNKMIELQVKPWTLVPAGRDDTEYSDGSVLSQDIRLTSVNAVLGIGSTRRNLKDMYVKYTWDNDSKSVDFQTLISTVTGY